jgi:hypothetical protein
MHAAARPRLTLDHLAVAAPTLAAGLAHVRAALGLDLPPGGRHPAMATHNHLMRFALGEYLEVIAPDPAAAAPGRPRWFGLDTCRAPRLAAWIARVDDLDAALAAAPVDLGRPLGMSRGDLTWRIAVPDDGTLPMDGIAPVLIEWPEGPHPSRRMADAGARLLALDLAHPRAADLAPWLAAHLADDRIRLTQGAPALLATIATQAGSFRLG